MNILLKIIFVSLLSLSSAYGAGAAGTISVRNSSDLTLKVTYSGLGCDGYAWGFLSVCGYGILEPDQISHWDYGWGVTTTWINIGDNDSPNQDEHPCSEDSVFYDLLCYIDHQVVKTKAYKTDNCNFTHKGGNKLICARE